MGEPAPSLYVPEAGKVAIRDPDGSVWKIPQEKLADEQAKGARPATEAEFFGAQHGRGGEVAAGLTGAARGATFGVSDPLLLGAAEALGGNKEEYRSTLRLLKQSSPNASLGGEFLGTGALALGTGGLSLGEGAAARLGVGALEGAGIGAAAGLGGQLSEDTLENHKASAEAYLSAGVKGGAIGLLLGGAGAGVGLLGRGGGRAAEKALVREEAVAVRAAGTEAEKVGGRVAIDADAGLASKAGAVESPFAIGKASRPVALDESLLTNTSPIQSAKGVRSYRSFAEPTIALDAEAGLSAKAGNFEKPFAIGKGGVGLRSGVLPEAAAQAPIAVDREILTWPGIRPDAGLEKVPSRIKNALHVESPAGLPRPVGLTDGIEGGIVSRPGLRIEAPPIAPAPQTMLGRVEGLRDSLSTKALRDAELRGFPFREAIDGAGALATGNVFGVGSAAINAARRLYGAQASAHVLDAALRLDTFRRATTKLDQLIDGGAKAFASGSKGTTRAVKPVTTAEVRAIREAVRTPEAVTARVAEHLGDMPRIAPKVAAEIAATAARAAAWMQHALPKEQTPISPRFGKPREIPLSDEQLLDARAIIETVEDGSVVVDRLREGRLNSLHVATLRYVHPETFLKIQKYLTQHTTELNQSLNQQQLTRLGILFGEPLTEQDLPENVRAFQASFIQGNQAPGTAGSGGNVQMNDKPVNVGQTSATPNDRLSKGTP